MSSVEQQRLKKWIDVLQDNDSEMSRIAAQKLADIGSNEAVPHLIKAMETRTMFVAAAAAQAIGKIGDRKAVQALSDAMLSTRQDVVVQQAAAEALGEIGHHTAVKALKQVIDDYVAEHKGDRHTYVRGYQRGLFTSAIRSLKQIGTPEARRIARNAERI